MPHRLHKYHTDPSWKSMVGLDKAIVVGAISVLVVLLIGAGALLINAKITNATEIVVAIIGLASVCFTAYIGYLQASGAKEALAQAEREMSFQAASLDFAQFIAEWGDTIKEIEKLMQETCIDHFLILRAWNGYLEPRWTTAVLQVRQGTQDVVSYVHFELDTDYVDRLRRLATSQHIVFDVASLPEDASIRKVYELEGITAAAWYQLLAQQLENTESRAVTYCSFATHSGSIDQNTLTRCAIIAGRLKGVAYAFK